MFIFPLMLLLIILCALYAFVDFVILDGMLSTWIQEYIEKRLPKND
jgi:hypothetical protein